VDSELDGVGDGLDARLRAGVVGVAARRARHADGAQHGTSGFDDQPAAARMPLIGLPACVWAANSALAMRKLAAVQAFCGAMSSV
jgi:hypothetical protein